MLVKPRSLVDRHWADALDRLERLDRPFFALDELPYLTDVTPELPSLLQRYADAGKGPPLILAGSALSTMSALVEAARPARPCSSRRGRPGAPSRPRAAVRHLPGDPRRDRYELASSSGVDPSLTARPDLISIEPADVYAR